MQKNMAKSMEQTMSEFHLKKKTLEQRRKKAMDIFFRRSRLGNFSFLRLRFDRKK